jgi:hypothetical protein
MYLEFIAVPEDKVIKNRVHRGCSAGTLEELEAEIERWPSLEPRSRGRSTSLAKSLRGIATSCFAIPRGMSCLGAECFPPDRRATANRRYTQDRCQGDGVSLARVMRVS